jgi:hypothetical protein
MQQLFLLGLHSFSGSSNLGKYDKIQNMTCIIMLMGGKKKPDKRRDGLHEGSVKHART